MKLISPALEKKAIRSICSSPKLVAGRILASLNEEYFHYDPIREAFKRISRIAKRTGEVPSYSELTTDTSLSEESRKALLRNKEARVKSKKSATKLVQGMDRYRKLRGLYFNSNETLDLLQQDKVDLDDVLTKATNNLTRLRTNAEKHNHMLHLGYKGNSKAMVKQILYGKKPDLIPTGFAAFDDENGGIHPGSLWVIASTSGGGKSTMASQVMLNMTRRGYNTALVPLEMSDKETMYRVLSNVSQVPLTKIIRHTCTQNEKLKIKRKFRLYERKLARLKARYTIYSPDEEMTAEEILFLLKPYGYRVMVIDYAGLLKGIGDEAAVHESLGEIARMCKRFAQANNVIVVLLAQLADDMRVKYSQALKEHADVCWIWNYTDETKETGILDIRQLKARNLNPMNFQLSHDYSVMRIGDVDDETLKSMRSGRGDEKRKALDKFEVEINVEEDDSDEKSSRRIKRKPEKSSSGKRDLKSRKIKRTTRRAA